MIKRTISLTTSSGGAATAYADPVPGNGFLYAIQLVDGNFDDGVDIAITAEEENLSIPLYTKADFNTDQMVYPRTPTAAVADGSALTNYAEPLVIGRIKAVIAQGGDTKTGSIVLYIREA